MTNRILSIDLETFSKIELKKAGLYRYVSDPSFQILLFAYKYNNGPVKIVDLAKGEQIPTSVVIDLTDPEMLKKSFNAQFERVALSKLLGRTLDPKQWRCTMIKCASLGLPMSLEHAATALGLEQQKNKDGKSLITFFCKPCKPTKANGQRTRNLPEHAPDKWHRFKSYCVQDVVVEDAIDEKVAAFEIPEQEHQLWQLDQRINDGGVHVYPKLISQAIQLYEISKVKLFEEIRELTGSSIDPRKMISNDQLKKWLQDELPFDDITSLDKHHVGVLLKSCDDEVVRRVLEIRQETSKSSIDKYTAMQVAMNIDCFIRGMLQFFGARTGRWAGRIVQPQNLIRNSLKELDYARQLVIDGDIDMIELWFGSLSMVLSQLIRTAFIPREGYRLVTSDFKAIEARVIAWLAEEKWKLDIFRGDGLIYEATGARMFGIDAKLITKDSDYRQRAKIAELACGFQGSIGAIKRMWPKYLPLPSDAEIKQIVKRWRDANQCIVALWWDVQSAAIAAIKTGRPQHIARCTFIMKNGTLFCELPSGRSLAYLKPRLYKNQWGKDGIVYFGINQTTRQWMPIQTYGGKLVENIVQAISRDLLGEKMLLLDKYGHRIMFHVHDEVIIESKNWEQDAKKIHKIMKHPIAWASGLPIDASTDILTYYKKD